MRARLRAALIVERALLVGTWFVAAGVGLVALDWLLVLPSLFRVIDFVLAVAALLAFVHYFIVPATQFRPRLVDVARRVERAMPPLRGRLASALEFEIADDDSPFAKGLQDTIGPSLAEACRARVVDRGVLAKQAKRAALAVVIAAVPWMVDMHVALIGTRRLLQPWSAIRWPASTQVDSLVEVTHAARGMPVRLRAALTKGDPSATDVSITWELVGIDGGSTVREAIAPRQPDGTYEFLLEPALAERVVFRFSTPDAESLEQVVRFVDPPAVRLVQLTVQPPAYALGIRELASMEFSVNAGADGEVVRADPVLEGSRIDVTLWIAHAPPCPPSSVDDGAFATWATKQWRLGGGADDPAAEVSSTCEGDRWMISWSARGNDFLDVTPTDQRGLSAPAPLRVAIDAVPDERPSVTLEEPAQDERVVGLAAVQVVGRLTDDVGLAWGAVELDRIRVGEGQTQVVSTRHDQHGTTADLTQRLELADVGGGCVAGDQLELRVLAQDLSGEALGRPPVSSVVRRLRVVSRAQFEQDVASAAQAIRSQVVRADGRQEEVERADPTERRAIAQEVEVAERAASARESAKQLVDRLERNGLAGESLTQAAREAMAQLDQAGSEAGRARDLMQRAGEAQEAGDEASVATATRDVREAQRAVRDALATAAGLLERDDDLWSLRRDMERIEERLDAAQAARESMTPASAGKRPEELQAGDQDRSQQAMRETEQATEQARDVLDELRQRADAMAQSNPERSQAMRDAAQRAERAGLTESLEQSAEASRQNQQDQAQQSAEAARAALGQMEEALEQEEKLQLESLRRKLASLVERLTTLVAQSTQLEEAIAGRGDGRQTADMVITLFHNTGAAQDEAGAIGPDGVSMVKSIARAAEQQSATATMLRSSNVEWAGATEAMGRSTQALQEALDVAQAREAQAEQQQQQQRVDALRGKYVALLPEQEAVVRGVTAARDDTLTGRRLLMESRRLATQQSGVLEQLEAIATEPDVGASAAFQEAHRVAREAAMSAGNALNEGRVDDVVSGDAAIVLEVIAGLADALASESQAKDRFGRNQLAGGEQGAAGGGAGPEEDQLPPAAELKLLKSLQGQLSRRTRQISEGSPPRRGEAADLAARQKSVARLVQALADKLEEKGAEDAGVGGGSGPPGGTRERNPRELGPGIQENPPGFSLPSRRDVRHFRYGLHGNQLAECRT